MTTAPAHRTDVFGQAEQTAHEWLATVATALATEDRHRAHRVVRAWLHAVRDRLTVEAAVHFAAQLPLVWRGLFYDGWRPRQVPVKYDADQFLMTVAQDAGLTLEQARQATPAVTGALAELTSADHVGHLLAQLPGALRQVLEPGGRPTARAADEEPQPDPRVPADGTTTGVPVEDRVDRLADDVQLLADALGALLEALDEPPSTELEPRRFAAGVRRAHQILLSRALTG